MNRDSNVYTFLFATLMVFIVASSLAFTATSLKERQISNVRKEKMQNILATIGIETEREAAEGLYNEHITKELTLKKDGSVDPDVNAFDIKLNNELRKSNSDQRFPIYVAVVEERKSASTIIRKALKLYLGATELTSVASERCLQSHQS